MERALKLHKAKSNWKVKLFIFLMLVYPVTQFAVMWIFVNIDSVLLSFQKFVIIPTQKYPVKGWNWVGFENFLNLFDNIRIDAGTRQMFLTSVLYLPLNCFIILPITIVVSYFLCRKLPLRGILRIVFYLPNIIPLVILTLSFKLSLDPSVGYINKILESLGITPPEWFGYKWARPTVYLFCLWSGIGGNIIMISGAINRVPQEILEAGKMDGISMPREFFSVIIPLIWPTLSILMIFGMMGVFGVAFQPLFLLGSGVYNTETIGLKIYLTASGGVGLENAATLGLFVTLFMAPLIVFTRFLMDKCFSGVEY